MPRRVPSYVPSILTHSLRAACTAILFVAVVSTIASASTATVRILRVRGNSEFTGREILSWLGLKESLPFSAAILEADLHVIRDRYINEGYLAIDVRNDSLRYSEDSLWVDVTYAVDEGRQSVVGTVLLEGTSAISSDDALSRFETVSGTVLRQSTLEQDITDLLVRYEKLGFAFARCSFGDIRTRQGKTVDSLDVVIIVDEGRRVTIDEFRIDGVKETEPGVILRETRISPGEVFDPAKVEAIRPRLNRLNIFASVDEPSLYVRDGKGGLLIKVHEGSTNTFDGIIGYLPPPPEGGNGTVTGLVSIGMRNLFGTGRRLNVRWQRDNRSTQEIAVRYLEPWIAGIPVNIGGGFFQRQQDSAYVRRMVDVNGEFMLSERISIGAVFASERVIPSSTISNRRADASSTFSIGGFFRYDSRDDLISPESGVRLSTDYQGGKKKLTDASGPSANGVPVSAGVQRILSDLELYYSPWRRQVVALGLHGRQVQGANLDESDLYRFGGARTLRGHRENEFVGSLVAWSNAEYRFIVARRSFLFGFFDSGYYRRPDDPRASVTATEEFTYGYGFGILLDTALGNLAVSFALGEGSAIGNAMVHIGLISEF